MFDTPATATILFRIHTPFVRTFRCREVVLAHNGTLEPAMPEAALKFHPVGETDSEYLLCAMLTILATRSIRFRDFQGVEAVLRDVNLSGCMNLLFSEGDHLYCYCDKEGYNDLCVTEGTAPFDRVWLQDEDWEVDLAEEKRLDQRGVVIATRPLTDEQLDVLPAGRLRVFRDGQFVLFMVRARGLQPAAFALRDQAAGERWRESAWDTASLSDNPSGFAREDYVAARLAGHVDSLRRV